ncbi:MAG: PmoA family protein [Verrucomicrobiales bacterium]|nr:PmoA family protein [Verrucomicrobiales bacterium]
MKIPVFLICFLIPALALADPVHIELDAGKFDRPAGTIITAVVTGFPGGATGAVIEPGQIGGQIAGGKLFWRLNADLKAGEKRRFTAQAAKVSGSMGCAESDAAIELNHAGKPVLRFIKKPTAEAKNHEPAFTRTGYIHPLLTPAGREITGDYPADHVHQHALFFAWTKTKFEGRKPEFWNQKLQAGQVRYAKTNHAISGPVFAEFSATNLCEDLTADEPKPVVSETWQVRVWQTGEDNDSFLVDLELTQACASDSPLEIEKYHYGGMAIRGNSAWMPGKKGEKPPGSFLTSEDKSRENGNHSRPEWVSLHGPLEGGHASVTIFPHPENFRHPQWVRLHPSKPYFVFSPMVEEPFEITPETPYRVAFRYLVEDRKPDPEKLEVVRRNFADPPVARQVAE